MPPSIPTATREAAVAQYVAGEGSEAIAARHGISASSVIGWVRMDGHKIRPAGRAQQRAHLDDLAYFGGWVVRGGIQVPLLPERRSA